MNILITAIGRRVELIEHFKKDHKVIGVDATYKNAGREFVDKFYIVPKASELNYINKLISICKKEDVDIIIPLYEPEFMILDDNRIKFNKIGTKIVLSSDRVLSICLDKQKTYEYFKKKLLLPEIYNMVELNEEKFPSIIKPRRGMGSSGIYKVDNLKELKNVDIHDDNIIQEYIDGEEYTVDLLLDLKGRVISSVPRERLEIRGGEVSKSRTIHDKELIDLSIEVCRILNAEESHALIGPINIQFIKHNNKYFLIEINPRFGGGVPLSIEAGIDYSKLIGRMYDDIIIKQKIGLFEEIEMYRYDRAVYKEV